VGQAGSVVDGEVEYVVLLDEDGQPCGRARKDQVHTAATPLHLAFSCWVLSERADDDAGVSVLLTRRAWSKRTWPGVWTNSFCGHPGPGEAVEDAVRRRARQELGTGLRRLSPALPSFRYTATMDDGTRENEVCPVFTASLDDEPAPDPLEVAEWRWAGVDELERLCREAPLTLSPWLRMQLPLLLDAGWLRRAPGGTPLG
jgi:isopentenyl-diphosphate delta-isomerase